MSFTLCLHQTPQVWWDWKFGERMIQVKDTSVSQKVSEGNYFRQTDTESQLIYSIFSAVRSPQFFTHSPVNFLNLPLRHSSWLLFSKLPVKNQQKIFRIIPEVPPKQQDQNRTIICRMSKFKKPFMQLKIYIYNKFLHNSSLWHYVDWAKPDFVSFHNIVKIHKLGEKTQPKKLVV